VCHIRKSRTRGYSKTSSSLPFFIDDIDRSAHLALRKRNTQPMLIRFRATGTVELEILEKQLHEGREKKILKFRD